MNIVILSDNVLKYNKKNIGYAQIILYAWIFMHFSVKIWSIINLQGWNFQEVSKMHLINNRYRIKSSIKFDNAISSYIAVDLKNKNEVQLNVFNVESIMGNLMPFFRDEFTALSNIDCSNIIKLYDFEVINTIDNKRLSESTTFYYSCEPFEGAESFKNFINEADATDIINVFIKICRCSYYLHLKGFIYQNFEQEDILIRKDNGIYTVKLKDMAAKKLNMCNKNRENAFIFSAPEVLYGSVPNNLSDIYSLGILLLTMLNKITTEDIESAINRDSMLDELKNRNDSFLNKFIPIIDKMTQTVPEERFVNEREIIESLINIIGIKEEIFNKNELQKLPQVIKIIGRNYEIETVLSLFDANKTSNVSKKFVFIHGDTGMGKTRLLDRLKHLLSMKDVNVFFGMTQGMQISEILKQVSSECDREIIEKYKEEIGTFIPEASSNEIQNDVIKPENTNTLILMNRITNFLQEYLKKKKTVFIIDDIHLCDSFTIDFIKYAYKNLRNNITFIISYSDSSYMPQELSQFIQGIENSRDAVNIKLNPLNFDDTTEMIRNILMMPIKPVKFSGYIYNKTYGNPSFIREILNDLVSRGIIYINNNGKWYTDFPNFQDIPLPDNMEQVISSQVSMLNKREFELIKFLCIFKTAPSYSILKDMNFEEELKSLSRMNIVCVKIDDRGMVYEISNRILKELVYRRLSDCERLELHRKAAEMLEMNYKDTSIMHDELIYHLQIAGDNEKIFKYCMEDADIMEKLKDRAGAVNSLVKALGATHEEENIKAYLDICLRIGVDYFENGNYGKSIEYCDIGAEKASRYGLINDEIDFLNRACYISYIANEIQMQAAYLAKIEELIKDADYDKGLLQFRINKMTGLCMKKQFKASEELALKIVPDCCSEEYTHERGILASVIAYVYLMTSRYSEALNKFKESIECYNHVGAASGAIRSLNNIGAIYNDYYQDVDKAISYFKNMRELCIRSNMPHLESLALINLSDSYSYKWDYKLIYKYLCEALSIAQKTEQLRFEYYCVYSLASVCLKLGKIKEGLDYFTEAKKYVEKYPSLKDEININYDIEGEILHSIGDDDNALILFQKAVDYYGDAVSIPNINVSLQIINIKLRRAKDIKERDELLKSAYNILEKYTLDLYKIDAVYNLCMILESKGWHRISISLMKKYGKCADHNIPDTIKAKQLYLESFHAKKKDKIEILKEALVLCKKENAYKLEIDVLIALGDYLFQKGKIFDSINYYYKVKDLVHFVNQQIPEEYKSNNILDKFTEGLNKKLDDLKSDYDEKMLHRPSLPEKLNSFRKLVENLPHSDESALDLLCRYIQGVILATNCMIIICEDSDCMQILASASDKAESSISFKYTIERALAEKKLVMLTDASIALPYGIRAVLSVPIAKGIVLYAETENYINNFNSDYIQKCSDALAFMKILAEKYQLGITSNIDKLTRTLTRKALEEELDSQIEMHNDNSREFSIVMYDLDDFKSINDKFGHQAGDNVLRSISGIVLNKIKDRGKCGRYGGEEFIIILPGLKADEALQVAEEIRKDISGSVKVAEENVTVSMGISSFPVNGVWKQELIEKADQALYVAKALGKNRCQIWEESFSQNISNNKLNSIITGNLVQDYRNISVIDELAELIREKADFSDKVYAFLGRVIEITEAENGTFMTVDGGKISEKFSRKSLSREWAPNVNYNEELVSKVIETKEGVYMIDWNYGSSVDQITGLPDWPSVMVIPLITNSELKAILYLSVKLTNKEFNYTDYNFVSCLGQIFTAVIR